MFPHAAIRGPLSINGRKAYLLLDIGAFATVLQCTMSSIASMLAIGANPATAAADCAMMLTTSVVRWRAEVPGRESTDVSEGENTSEECVGAAVQLIEFELVDEALPDGDKLCERKSDNEVVGTVPLLFVNCEIDTEGGRKSVSEGLDEEETVTLELARLRESEWVDEADGERESVSEGLDEDVTEVLPLRESDGLR